MNTLTPIAFDIETTGFNPREDEIFSYSLGYEDGSTEVYRLDGKDGKENLGYLKDFFSDTSLVKVCHNFHFEMKFVRKLVDVPDDTKWHDTMIMSQILWNTCPSHALDYLSYHLAEYPTEQDKEITRLYKLYRNYKSIPVEFMDPYQRADAERTMLLYLFLWPQIQSNVLEEDYQNEINTVITTVRLEEVGIRLHSKNAEKKIDFLDQSINEIQVELYNTYGRFINLSSDKQLGHLLYKELKYKPLMFSAKTKEPITNKEALYKYREMFPNDRIFDLLLMQRTYIKAKSTIKKYLDTAVDGILFPNIGVNEARTGRQTSKDPPLQNVSKNESLVNPYHVAIRDCFRAHERSILLLVDYQAIEMRLIVFAAGDEVMLDILNSGGDLHQEAMECFRGVDYVRGLKEKNPKLFSTTRKADKNAHFAIGYGGSVVTVANACGLDPIEFRGMYNRYKERHPKIVELFSTMMKKVREDGYVETPFGRKLNVDRGEAFAGLNYYIQGTAAGILKRAEVKVDALLKKEYNDEIRIILPIHDELIINLPRKYMQYKSEVIRKITDTMTDINHIDVKLDVEWKSSKTTWDKAKEEVLV